MAEKTHVLEPGGGASRWFPLRWFGLRSELTALVVVSVIVAAWTWAPIPPGLVDAWYSRRLYPVVAAILIGATDWTDVPLGVFSMPLVAVAILWRAGVAWRKAAHRGVPVTRRILRSVVRAGLLACLVYLLFVFVWGAGYRRTPIMATLELENNQVKATAAEVALLAEKCLEVIDRDGEGTTPAEHHVESLEAIRDSLSVLVRQRFGFDPPLPTHVKRLPAGSLLGFGTSGTIFPFSLEAHVDKALPPAASIAVGAHELAHIAGFNGEAEAELIGLLAAWRSRDPFVRYAAALSLLRRAVAEVPASERARLLARLPQRATDDLTAIRDVVTRYRFEWLASSQSVVYDAFLRSQGVTLGRNDYSRALDLAIKADRLGLFPDRLGSGSKDEVSEDVK